MSEYTDAKNNKYKIIEKSLISDEKRREIQSEVVEELYRIFAHR